MFLPPYINQLVVRNQVTQLRRPRDRGGGGAGAVKGLKGGVEVPAEDMAATRRGSKGRGGGEGLEEIRSGCPLSRCINIVEATFVRGKGEVHPEVTPPELQRRRGGGLEEGDVREERGVLKKDEDSLFLLGPRDEEVGAIPKETGALAIPVPNEGVRGKAMILKGKNQIAAAPRPSKELQQFVAVTQPVRIKREERKGRMAAWSRRTYWGPWPPPVSGR